MDTSAVNQFLLERPFSKSTKEQYRRILENLLEIHPDPQGLTAESFLAWLNGHDTWGGAMTWLAYSAVRSFIRWAYGNSHPALRLRIKRTNSGPQRTLTPEQARKLLNCFDDSPKGIRDKAIFATLLDTGIRSSELCKLELDHLTINQLVLSVPVKGGAWEYGIFSEITAGYLTSWLEIRPQFARAGVKSVFVSLKGITPGHTITPGGFRAIVRTWGKAADIGPLSPHDMRRSFATIATLAGSPTRSTQMAGRWKRINEVERYTQALRLSSFLPYSPVKFVLGTTGD